MKKKEQNGGNESLSPDNFDIRELKKLLDGIEDMLFPNSKQGRPTITYSVESGSVRNIFRTSWQTVVSNKKYELIREYREMSIFS